MNIKKFFILSNYIDKVKLLQKKIKIIKLQKLSNSSASIKHIWNINENKNFDFKFCKLNEYSIFGININLEEKIIWHQDKFSGFVYPLKRFDKINAAQWFNQGVELVFPWELSRFYFGINLAQKYLINGDTHYYEIFRKQINDWIESNPFLYGVNWLSTMDVAIRAVNWIVTLNLFQREFFSDTQAFRDKISVSLIQHAEYIFSFPLIEKDGLTTNHTIAAFTGLFFLALTLRENSKSDLWIKTAKDGLEKCIQEQVYNDGSDYEGSIPYHRLVLELFVYSTILGISNGVKFSNNYFEKLFKMFEFSAAYMDKNGNAPQIGDNDSGRLLIFNALNNDPYKNEHEHSYLLSLGEHIFDYRFKSKCSKKDADIWFFLPWIKKVNASTLNIIFRETNKSISFNNAGAFILKNEKFDLMVSCFPSGQNGKGGHNHLDMGSFTLSIDGEPVIVDPGTYCYTKDRKQRDKFRAYTYHNTLYNLYDRELNLNENGYWSLKNYYSYDIVEFSKNKILFEIEFLNENKKRRRFFELKENILIIKNEYAGEFFAAFYFHPKINLSIINTKIYAKKFTINSNSQNTQLLEYEYSDHYGKKEKSQKLLLNNKNIQETILTIL